MYLDNDSKLIIVVNGKLDPGRLANALGHAIAGLVARDVDAASIEFLEYSTQANWSSLIAKNPIIVLKSDNSAQLARLHREALALNILFNVFVHTMLGSSATEQIEATSSANPDSFEYWAVALYSKATVVQPITKRFSLFK